MTQTPGIHVDVDELLIFAAALRSHLEHGLKPGVGRAAHEIRQEVRFGLAVPGGHVVACREAFEATLARTHENTKWQIHGAEILAAVIEEAFANYADAEWIAASRLAEIQDLLADAIRKANALRAGVDPAAGGAPPAAGPPPPMAETASPVTGAGPAATGGTQP